MNMPATLTDAETETRAFITQVYGWMSAGLALTGWIAWMIGNSPAMSGFLAANRILFYGLLIGELGLVIFLSRGIERMTVGSATLAFLAYAAFNGVTLSLIFLIYTAGSIASTFFVTAGLFGIMSFYGYVTKTDLTSMGNLLFMGLIGVILASVVNIFLRSEALMWATTYIGMLIFVGLTAYDTQKIKQMNILGNAGTDEDRKEAIRGALTLYLDFINLFLHMLRIMGRRR